MRSLLQPLKSRLIFLLPLSLVPAVCAYLLVFIIHACLILRYPFPLDYGEGPLLAQTELLRGGKWLWELYGDPAGPPYVIVNYPPVYLLCTTFLSHLIGNALLAGRVISLFATLGVLLALCHLAKVVPQRKVFHSPTSAFSLFFLTIPIVREWAVVLRVDLLGLGLGLWGIVAFQRAVKSEKWHWALLTSLLLFLSLATKPSLVAAPLAIFGSLLSQKKPFSQKLLLRLVVSLGLSGSLFLLLGQWATGGWFLQHVVAANANRWEGALGGTFWAKELRQHWSLFLAASFALILLLRLPSASPLLKKQTKLAGLYTLGGLLTALGVGKVGAYTNYFLELYAGLVWLIALAVGALVERSKKPNSAEASVNISYLSIIVFLLFNNLFYYFPTWSQTSLHRAGQLEPNPLRLAFGKYGLWADLQREKVILAAQQRIDEKLHSLFEGTPIFTDMPGIVAATKATSRLQVFEQRQLFDQKLWKQQSFLLELANGEIPLAAIDYLGNWLTPETVVLLQKRYARDGSLGNYKLFRPIDPGPLIQTKLVFSDSLQLKGYHLAAPANPSFSAKIAPLRSFQAGETLILTLEWQRLAPVTFKKIEVGLRLTNAAGQIVQETKRPLLYDLLPPNDWPTAKWVQHLQPLALPIALPSQVYTLSVFLQTDLAQKTMPQTLTQILVEPKGGYFFQETKYFTPEPFAKAWNELGGLRLIGYPLMPAVPFAWGTLQCFEYTCLELQGNKIRQRPLGELLYLAETQRSTICLDKIATFPAKLCPNFQAAEEKYGGIANLGLPISGEIRLNAKLVQWTRFARVEKSFTGGEISLGRLGDETLQLLPGERYPWPSE